MKRSWVLDEFDSVIPGSPASDLIAQLQAENQRHQELLNSLQAGNAGIGNAAQTATDTTQQIGSLVKENQQQLRGIKGSFEQNVLPGLNTSLDSFGQLSDCSISGVDPLVDQTKQILTINTASLNGFQDGT